MTQITDVREGAQSRDPGAARHGRSHGPLSEQTVVPGTEYARSIARSRRTPSRPASSSWNDTLQDGMTLVREHPMMVAGVVLAAGLMFARAPSGMGSRAPAHRGGRRDGTHIRSDSAYRTMRHIEMDDQAEKLFVTGLRNAHSLETEAEQIIQRQLDRLINYRQMAERLRGHLEETRRQKERLEHLLGRYGAGPSSIKETATTLMGNVAALAHSIAPDEVLKNTFANQAFEAFEIAAYRSLIAMAETYGQREALGLLRQSLAEEERMAAWLDDNVADITREFMTLRAHGEMGDR